MENTEFFEKYQTWWSNRTPDEDKLYGNILEYEEEYFEDMTFQPGSVCYETVSFIIDNFDFFSLEIEYFYFRYYVKELKDGTSGICDLKERTITISPKYKDDRSVILHEMIHAYEYILVNENPVLCELMLIMLYNKLKPSIPNLDELIKDHTELYGQHCIAATGGQHGILFYLKSLDLDLRCGYNLGKVCGYGRENGEMWYF